MKKFIVLLLFIFVTGCVNVNVTINKELADVYKDGEIDKEDITVLQRHLVADKLYKVLPYVPAK